ncbi:MAG: alpha/beta fold hydrolase [Pseudomonadaceae bacterium]
MNNLTLLPGWALAASNLLPLQQALQERLPALNIQLAELPSLQMSTLEPDLTALAEALPAGWLAGWSLGGMLAVQLQRRFPERFCGVITIASNACFAVRDGWPQAMAVDTFKAFLSDAREQPERILKRFSLLATQGSERGRELSKQLQWSDADPLQRLNQLALLGVMDNRIPLQRCAQPVLHCLGGSDALVPAAVEADLQALNEKARVRVLPQASHALPLEAPLWLAGEIADWLDGQ